MSGCYKNTLCVTESVLIKYKIARSTKRIAPVPLLSSLRGGTKYNLLNYKIVCFWALSGCIVVGGQIEVEVSGLPVIDDEVSCQCLNTTSAP